MRYTCVCLPAAVVILARKRARDCLGWGCPVAGCMLQTVCAHVLWVQCSGSEDVQWEP